MTDARGGLPLLAPMSEVAGRMAVQVGAHCLEKEQGGNGLLLGGVPGVAAAKVVILGGGVSGTNAARMAMGMEAYVTVIDRSLPRLYELDLQFGSQLHTLFSTVEKIEREVAAADLVIGAVLVPGAAAPKLVSRELVRAMRPGSVMVDISIDQGGCFETSRPTTHAKPTYVEEGVVHYCVTNMPGAVARTSAVALNNATLPFVLAIADRGWRRALSRRPASARRAQHLPRAGDPRRRWRAISACRSAAPERAAGGMNGNDFAKALSAMDRRSFLLSPLEQARDGRDGAASDASAGVFRCDADASAGPEPARARPVDDAAIAAITDLYREVMPTGGAILDLMSSWVSHLPPEIFYSPRRRRRRQCCANWRKTRFSTNGGCRTSTATRACLLPRASSTGRRSASAIQHLSRPGELIREVARVLKPGAPLVVTFSQRCLATRAIACWCLLDDAGQLCLVARHFVDAGNWSDIRCLDRTPPGGGSRSTRSSGAASAAARPPATISDAAIPQAGAGGGAGAGILHCHRNSGPLSP